MIHHYAPSLLTRHDFMQEFITPIVVVKKGKTQNQAFYTLPEYEAWKQVRTC